MSIKERIEKQIQEIAGKIYQIDSSEFYTGLLYESFERFDKFLNKPLLGNGFFYTLVPQNRDGELVFVMEPVLQKLDDIPPPPTCKKHVGKLYPDSKCVLAFLNAVRGDTPLDEFLKKQKRPFVFFSDPENNLNDDYNLNVDLVDKRIEVSFEETDNAHKRRMVEWKKITKEVVQDWKRPRTK